MTTQGRTRRSSDATEKADLVPAAAFSISSGFRVQSTQSCLLRSSRYGTTERPQSRGKPTSVSSVDDDAFAPKAAVRATAVEPSVQLFEGRSVSRGIHKLCSGRRSPYHRSHREPALSNRD